MGKEVETAAAPKGSILRFIIPAVLILGAAAGGGATYFLVLAPMLHPEEHAPADAEPGHGHGTDEEVEEPISLHSVVVPFDEQNVNLMREGDLPAAIVLYKVTLEVSNPETQLIVDAPNFKPRFLEKIQKPHLSKTRAEVDDQTVFQASTARIIKQQCNDLLRRLQEEPKEENRITAVFYDKFLVIDPN